MPRAIKVPELPELGADVPQAVRDWCHTADQMLGIAFGRVAAGTNTRFVTIQDLVDAGVVPDGLIK